MSENQLWDIDLFLLMHLDWDAFTIVPDCDLVNQCVDTDLDHCHFLVSLKVVGCVDQNFIYKIECQIYRAVLQLTEDLVKAGYVCD